MTQFDKLYNNSTASIIKMIEVKQSLKQLFGDVNYAWELLQSEVKLETCDHVNGDDISKLLQLYMRGVEKMNSIMDLRESFFKNKVTSLMSRPAVIRTLNKPMSKKSQAPIVQSIPVKKIDNKTQLQLKQKRKEMQMRLAYGAQEHNPDALKKMIAQQSQKQSFITTKMNKIIDSHEQRLMNRIKQRKLRTLTAKSRSQFGQNLDVNGMNQIGIKKKVQMMEKKRDQQQFGSIHLTKKQKANLRKSKSVSPKRSQDLPNELQSPSKRRISLDFGEVKLFNSLSK